MNGRHSLATAVLVSLMAGMGSPLPVITSSPRRKLEVRQPEVRRESLSLGSTLRERCIERDEERIAAAQSKRERRMARNKALNRDAAP